MPNPFLDRIKAQGTIGHGKKSEKRVAKTMGARLQPNSGAMAGAKSDATIPEASFRLEMKSTTADTLRLELGWLSKIADEALSGGQRPAVVVSFVDPEGKARQRRHAEWVLIPREIFTELITP